jgi:CBS-domain-containing membrane protein
MTLTNTVHPPGGATAVLAIVDPAVGALGWLFVPLILLGAVLMVLVALVVDNIQRRYPVYWWTAKEVGQNRKSPAIDVESANRSHTHTLNVPVNWTNQSGFGQVILISPEGLALPHEFHLQDHEMQVLKSLVAKLQTPEIEDTVTAEEVDLELQHQLRHHSQPSDSGEKTSH